MNEQIQFHYDVLPVILSDNNEGKCYCIKKNVHQVRYRIYLIEVDYVEINAHALCIFNKLKCAQ